MQKVMKGLLTHAESKMIQHEIPICFYGYFNLFVTLFYFLKKDKKKTKKKLYASLYIDAFKDSGKRSKSESLAVYRPSPKRQCLCL